MGGEIDKIWYPYETYQPVLVISKKIFSITPCRNYGEINFFCFACPHSCVNFSLPGFNSIPYIYYY